MDLSGADHLKRGVNTSATAMRPRGPAEPERGGAPFPILPTSTQGKIATLLALVSSIGIGAFASLSAWSASRQGVVDDATAVALAISLVGFVGGGVAGALALLAILRGERGLLAYLALVPALLFVILVVVDVVLPTR